LQADLAKIFREG